MQYRAIWCQGDYRESDEYFKKKGRKLEDRVLSNFH